MTHDRKETERTMAAIQQTLMTESMLGVTIQEPVSLADPMTKRARTSSWNQLVLSLHADTLPDLSDDLGDDPDATTDMFPPLESRMVEIPVPVWSYLRAYQGTYGKGRSVHDIVIDLVSKAVGIRRESWQNFPAVND